MAPAALGCLRSSGDSNTAAGVLRRKIPGNCANCRCSRRHCRRSTQLGLTHSGVACRQERTHSAAGTARRAAGAGSARRSALRHDTQQTGRMPHTPAEVARASHAARRRATASTHRQGQGRRRGSERNSTTRSTARSAQHTSEPPASVVQVLPGRAPLFNVWRSAAAHRCLRGVSASQARRGLQQGCMPQWPGSRRHGRLHGRARP